MAVLDLNEWERSILASHVSTVAMQYLGHYHDAGLHRHEVNTLNLYLQLSAKLRGDEPPEPVEYRGTRRNGFRKDLD